MITNVGFEYRGNYDSLESALNSGLLNNGYVVSVGDDVYVYCNNTFEKICPADSPDFSQESVKELIDVKCDHCGAPIRITSKFQTEAQCEYCNSVYMLR